MRASLFRLLLLTCFISSCTPHYRVIPLATAPTTQTPAVTTYAVAMNNVIIPEWVIDMQGAYPRTRDEAWQRFQKRRTALEHDVRAKYAIPATVPYQVERYTMLVGLCLVSPVVIPIMYVSDRQRYRHDVTHTITFGSTVRQYFEVSAHGTAVAPRIKNEFIEIKIPE